ncbi:MAG: HutD/Ves family protein [Rhodanobacteraceae bacterium]
MSALRSIPSSQQPKELWANGAGTTTVLLREPDGSDWVIRVSVARVDHEAPFSELRDTHRTLVPLDAPMALRFPDGRELYAARLGTFQFDGSPAPYGLLPDGPTRDFNLMLRGDARGEVLPRSLVDSMVLPNEPGVRWLVYLDSGSARIGDAAGTVVALEPRDAVMAIPEDGAESTILRGTGEIVLVKLYA